MPEAKVTCDKMVHGQRASFPCTEEEAHQGPCATPDVPKSVTERQNWEAAVATLGTVQGPAESMREQAERLAAGHADPQGSPALAGETQPIVSRTVTDAGPHSDNVTPMVDPLTEMKERQPQVVTGKATGKVDLRAFAQRLDEAATAEVFGGGDMLGKALQEIADATAHLEALKGERDVLITRVTQAAQVLHGPLFGEGATITKGDLTNVYGFLIDLATWLGYDPGDLEAPGPDGP